MKTYKSSDLTHKRAEVLKEAKANGVIVQQLETNGEVRQEFVITTPYNDFDNFFRAVDEVFSVLPTKSEFELFKKLIG